MRRLRFPAVNASGSDGSERILMRLCPLSNIRAEPELYRVLLWISFASLVFIEKGFTQNRNEFPLSKDKNNRIVGSL